MTGSQHGSISPYARLRSLDAPGFRLSLAAQEPAAGLDLGSAAWVSVGERAMRDGSKVPSLTPSRDWGCARRFGSWAWEVVHCESSGRASGAGLGVVATCWVGESPRAGKVKSLLSNCGDAVTGMRRWEMVPIII